MHMVTLYNRNFLAYMKKFLCFHPLSNLKNNIGAFLKLLVHILQGAWDRGQLGLVFPNSFKGEDGLTSGALPVIKGLH